MRVIIAAAGTGGHINPGIAIANKIKEENKDVDIRFIATGKKLEEDLISNAGYKSYAIYAYGFYKSLTPSNIKRMYRTLKGFGQAKKILKEFKPDIVIGTGGYICGAVLSAAKKLGIPTVLHESNAYPGLAVRLLEKKTDTILVGIEDAKNYLSKAKNVVYTGTPTKVKPIELSTTQKNSLLKELGLSSKLPIVLVFGGSQGAKRINDCICELLINKLNKNYQLIWATGQEQYDDMKNILKENNIDIEKLDNAKALPYIYNMTEIMTLSDLIVARSGAMTLTELAILGRPAIFIPLPSSKANRQEDNARVFEKKGAAKIIFNNELNKDILNSKISDIISNEETLINMSKAAKKLAIYNAEDKIYEEIKKLVG